MFTGMFIEEIIIPSVSPEEHELKYTHRVNVQLRFT